MTGLEEAILHLQAALHQSNSSPITRIDACRKLIRFCHITSDWQQAYEASSVAIRLIPRLVPRSLEHSDKQHMLRQVVGLASDAAAVALFAEKGPLAALNFLEEGRGVLAASFEELRVDVLDLYERHPELADQFVRLRDRLDLPTTPATSLLDGDRKSSWQAQASQRSDANQDFDKLILEIRNQTGFEDFLLAPDAEEMQAAASYGPIVVINVSKYRCDAVIVEQHQIRSLALTHLSEKAIEEKAQDANKGSLKVLEWLWDVVANPILDFLDFTQTPDNETWPHIWWITTGILSKFPLHAAGRHSRGSTQTVLDRVMSSYSSTVKAIIHGRRRRIPAASPTTPDQALLVAMQDTPGHARLPFAVREVELLRDLCKSMILNPIEPGRRKQDITSCLLNCKIFHFAGHGHIDSVDPSQSHLLLEDWKSDRLTVATLLEMNLRKRSPFLAFLSACGTGQIKDEKLIDEGIHLISAFQLAGFRHVIGTLWEVNDETCVDMSKITYEGMGDGGMTDESVCRGLHNAARELRERWLGESAMSSHGRKSAEGVGIPSVNDEMGAIDTSDGDERDNLLPRDVVLCDNEGTPPLPWVPYVHFGV
ncbi:hypothetical protein FALCPG4_015195 [Fusarium falciforme]